MIHVDRRIVRKLASVVTVILASVIAIAAAALSLRFWWVSLPAGAVAFAGTLILFKED